MVEFADRLMPMQVDDAGSSALRRRIEDLDVTIHTGMRTEEILRDRRGRVRGMHFANEGRWSDDDLKVGMVVFSAGIRPRDELAKAAGLRMGERGGVIVDEACRTSDPKIYAIGECALAPDGGTARRRIYGLVAPGYHMARVVADRILGGDAEFLGADMSTKLKLLGIDVASFGDAFATAPGAEAVTYSDPLANVYQRLVVGPPDRKQRRQVTGGMLVGDASLYQTLVQMVRGDMPTPEHPEELDLPRPQRVGPRHHGRRRPVRHGRHLLVQQRRQGLHLLRHRRAAPTPWPT